MTLEPEDESTVTLPDTWSVLQVGSEDSNWQQMGYTFNAIQY